MKNKVTCYIAVFFCYFFIVGKAYAQNVENPTGYPVYSKTYVDVEGSPFLKDEFTRGIVKLANGLTYKDVLLKYNQVEDAVYFQGKNDEVLAFSQPITEFTISAVKDAKGYFDKHYKNGFPSINNNTEKSFYEVLTDGTACLLKRTVKHIQETKPYNSATITRSVNADIQYYLFVSGKMHRINKDKKAVLAALGSKQSELDNYIKSNNLNLKNDADLILAIVYYNAL